MNEKNRNNDSHCPQFPDSQVDQTDFVVTQGRTMNDVFYIFPNYW